VGNAVADSNALARNFADAAHKIPENQLVSDQSAGIPAAERAAFIPVGFGHSNLGPENLAYIGPSAEH